ncbi:hypothetical protein ES288_D03G092600v1 [Gossypium darwinii]|uniref:MULE transposase domain-containing protein n=1 Tax=Gossypium darwinii TaxID=34276 RepID=A0A5D2D2L2_GOSDA|nr:hypothetical protein ES288_D03G092600v1 [Gossypium darwinii]
MEFSLLAKAPELYFSYAHVMGFGVRLGGTKADASGNVVTKYYYYNKEVKHVDKWMNHKKRVQNPQDMSRNRCKVEALAKRRVRIQPSQMMSWFADLGCGFEKFSFRKKDLLNINAAIEYFEAKRTNDLGLYMKYATDKNNHLENLFRANSRNKIDYAYFGDVVAFDTTYNNKCYDLSLLVFVGKHDNFVWMLNEFLNCKSMKKPILVVTDGDRVIHFTLESVLLEVNHRICVWHILKNVVSHIHKGLLALV